MSGGESVAISNKLPDDTENPIDNYQSDLENASAFMIARESLRGPAPAPQTDLVNLKSRPNTADTNLEGGEMNKVVDNNKESIKVAGNRMIQLNDDGKNAE